MENQGLVNYNQRYTTNDRIGGIPFTNPTVAGTAFKPIVMWFT